VGHAKRETTPCPSPVSPSTVLPGRCPSTLIEKARAKLHFCTFLMQRANDHGDAVAIAAAGDNGWMVLLTVRIAAAGVLLSAMVASHVAAAAGAGEEQKEGSC
jgi:hypothetical protein